MNRTKVLLSVGMLALLMCIALPTALAATDSSSDDEAQIGEGLNIGKLLVTVGPAGAIAGFMLSFIRVVGKHVQNEPDKTPDPKRFMYNVIIGVVSSVMVTVLHLDKITGTPEGTLGTSTAFMLVYVTNQWIIPILKNWRTSSPKAKTD